MSNNWRNQLISFLHDPPDKVLDIQKHEAKTAEYLRNLLDDQKIEAKKIHEDTRTEDILASGYERIFMPKSGPNTTDVNWNRSVKPEMGKLRIVHPLSGEENKEFDVSNIKKEDVLDAIKELTNTGMTDEERFYLVWRFLKELLVKKNPNWLFLPADSRIPDATIWNHLEISAGFKAVLASERYALLAFALSPVQGFIENARSAKDLWTGSYLLSKLTFAGVKPVLDEFGPCVFVYPSLHGNPFVDAHLEKKFNQFAKFKKQIHGAQNTKHLIASLPNKFFALITSDNTEEWVNRVKQSVNQEWLEICKKIHNHIQKKFTRADPHWDVRWNRQIENYFDISAIALPTDLKNLKNSDIPKYFGKDKFSEVSEAINNLQQLARLISVSDRYYQATFDVEVEKIGIWQLENKLTSIILDAKRSIRHVPDNKNQKGDVPGKCTMFGTFEQMGPSNLSDSSRFWEQVSQMGHSLKKNERFCALGLVKRYYPEVYFPDVSYPDTATIATRLWLKENGIDPAHYWNTHKYWSGQWVFKDERIDTEDKSAAPAELKAQLRNLRDATPPPKYYALIMLDGDHMGKWIQGEKSPTLRNILHPTIVNYFEKSDLEKAKKLLETKKIVSPSLHAAISEALANFSMVAVPEIVQKHSGELIYAGGDDVMVLLPAENAIECAKQLNLAFRGELHSQSGCPLGYYDDQGKRLLMMGTTATASAGIVVAHYKDDLREVVREARIAEKTAKNGGRNLLCLSVLKRSGEHSKAFIPWNKTDVAQCCIDQFKVCTDQWVYKLKQELHVFQMLDDESMLRETERLIAHSGDNNNEKQKIQEIVKQIWEIQIKGDKIQIDRKENFVKLLQSLSFMARGRDR